MSMWSRWSALGLISVGLALACGGGRGVSVERKTFKGDGDSSQPEGTFFLNGLYLEFKSGNKARYSWHQAPSGLWIDGTYEQSGDTVIFTVPDGTMSRGSPTTARKAKLVFVSDCALAVTEVQSWEDGAWTDWQPSYDLIIEQTKPKCLGN